MSGDMKKLKEKKLFLLDMDGTIYLDDALFDGTLDFLSYVKSIGGKYMFLTNNSSKSADTYIEKLKKMGIACDKEDFFTSTDATVVYLREKNYKKIYAFGTKAFKEQLKQEGFPVTDVMGNDIDCLCMGFDTELTFQKLEDACIILRDNAIDYIATNPDWVCPTWYGFVPDCGSVSSMIFNATGRKPVFIGKPKPDMINLAVRKTGFTKEQAVMIGDRLYTDIASGVHAGISTVFVLSGEGKREDIQNSNVKPEYIFENIKAIYDFFKS